MSKKAKRTTKRPNILIYIIIVLSIILLYKKLNHTHDTHDTHDTEESCTGRSQHCFSKELYFKAGKKEGGGIGSTVFFSDQCLWNKVDDDKRTFNKIDNNGELVGKYLLNEIYTQIVNGQNQLVLAFTTLEGESPKKDPHTYSGISAALVGELRGACIDSSGGKQRRRGECSAAR